MFCPSSPYLSGIGTPELKAGDWTTALHVWPQLSPEPIIESPAAPGLAPMEMLADAALAARLSRSILPAGFSFASRR